MTISIIGQLASENQIRGMLEELGTYIKLAADVERQILAGGGEYHADCEEVFLEEGSRQVPLYYAERGR